MPETVTSTMKCDCCGMMLTNPTLADYVPVILAGLPYSFCTLNGCVVGLEQQVAILIATKSAAHRAAVTPDGFPPHPA